MKNTYRILGAILLTVIYCSAIGFVAKSFIDYDTQSNKTTEEVKYFSSISTNYSFFDAPKLSSSVNTLTTFSVITLKKLFYELWVTNKVAEKLLETEFCQYTSFSINFLIEHRKKDIIFPFHYFW
jgi:hypothetical protein